MSADHTYISSGGEDDVSRVCPVFRAILGGDETIVLRVNSLPLYKMDSTPRCVSVCLDAMFGTLMIIRIPMTTQTPSSSAM